LTQTRRKTKNLAQTPEIDKITLADGKEYELAPLNLNMMVEIEDEFGESFDAVLKGNRAKPVRFLLYLRLKEKYPDMTVEKLGGLIDISVLASLNENLGIK